MAIRSDPIEGATTSSRPVDEAELVHEARKAIKRMRALARLLRKELGEDEFKRVNSSLRSAATRLAGARDAEVRLATLQALAERHPRALAPPRIQLLKEQLESERVGTIESSDRGEVLADIAAMRRELARWNLLERDFDALEPGLRRIYREGRDRGKLAVRGHARNAQDLHDWRKRVKSLYYVLDMLVGGAKSTDAREARRQADRLGDLLGEEHDLWMLRVFVEEHPEAFEDDEPARHALLDRIERRRQRLRERALKLGARLYERKPRDFTRRVGSSLAR
jgi:CHAD domain-containing protein